MGGASVNRSPEVTELNVRTTFAPSNDDDLSGLAVAVQVVICVLATSRRSIGPRSGAL
jgi:hypothetical protein